MQTPMTSPAQKAADKTEVMPETPDNILVQYLKGILSSAHDTVVNGQRLDAPVLTKGTLRSAIIMIRRELNDIALDRKTGETQGGDVLHG